MKKTITLLTAAIVATAVMSFSIMDSSGKKGKTNAPGETTCNDGGCHSGNALNSAGGSITITAPTLTNWEYTPGQVYVINVIVAKTGVSKFGFDFEALTSAGANGGTITVTNSTQTQTQNITISGNSRTNIIHKTNGGTGTAGTHTFTFNWTAPSTNIGNVTFYAAGNATNSNGSTSGDFIYTTSRVITPDSSTSIADNDNSNIHLSVYPNPVAESTTVSYQLTENATVSARLISLSGQVVTTFFKETQTAGVQNKQLTIDPTIAKGVYLIAIDVNQNHNYKRIVIK